MKRNAIGLILTLGLLAVSPLAARSSPNIDCQPLVIYDVSGFGIAGPLHQHLAVYSDGMTSVSSLVLTRSTVPGAMSVAQTSSSPASTVSLPAATQLPSPVSMVGASRRCK